MAVTMMESSNMMEPADVMDPVTNTDQTPQWSSSSLPDGNGHGHGNGMSYYGPQDFPWPGFYMPSDDEPGYFHFAGSPTNVETFSPPGSLITPFHSPIDYDHVGSHFLQHMHHSTQVFSQVQQQQHQLLLQQQLQQQQPPPPLTPIHHRQYHQRQQHEKRAKRASIQIQTHSFQQSHSPDNDHYAQLYTPAMSDDFENFNYRSNSYLEVRPKKFSRSSEASSSDCASIPISPVSQTSPTDMGGDPTKLGQRNREKNRLAASKCREKSKKFIDDLRVQERELTAQRAKLTADAARLKEEVLELKHEILRHGNCNCDFIRNYLTSAAKGING